MRQGKLIFVAIIISILLGAVVYAAAPAVRIKNLVRVLEARQNQLMGFGLVVGLKNTGDTTRTGFTQQALTNLLSRMGVLPREVDFQSRNVAAVMVTTNLSAYIKPGEKIDVTVSSLGDATNLQGGTLLLTPLMGADGEVYAVAQGSLMVGATRQGRSAVKGTVGRVPEGAIVEKEVPVSVGRKPYLSLVLNRPDFTTASRIAYTISKKGIRARARDAGTVLIPIGKRVDIVALISQIENLTVVPDSVAKVVINERTGTIVIGEKVRVSPVAVSFGDVDVQIGVGEGGFPMTKEKPAKFVSLNAGTEMRTLIRALNAVGASSKDMVAILQAIKVAGALQAELEII